MHRRTCGEVVSCMSGVCDFVLSYSKLSAMEKTATVLVFLSLLAHILTLEIPQVFYVKPTVAPTTECPSDDSPCHSLQYYANHSSFTNNNRFLFLEGEHHLDSVVTISNVANLSLVGLSSGVEILCKSVPSGFHVETFIEFNIENMAITSCTRSENTFLSLLNGADVRLKYFNMSGSYVATNVLGTFSIFASTFFSPRGGRIQVDYSLCNGPSYFNFSKSKLHEIDIDIGMHCTGIHVLVEDSTLYSVLKVDYSVLTNNSFFVSNSIVTGDIAFNGDTICFGSQCHSAAFLRIMNTTFNATDVTFMTLEHPDTIMCTVLIEDSTFLSANSYYGSEQGDYSHTAINVEIKNTRFVDSGGVDSDGNFNSAIKAQSTIACLKTTIIHLSWLLAPKLFFKVITPSGTIQHLLELESA